MHIVRLVGAILLAVAAVAVWFVLAPAKSASSPDFSSAISQALSDYDTNNANTESAPQQQVLNGWVAKDLLTVIARAQNAAVSPRSAPRDDRLPAEMLLAVLGVALIAATTPRMPSEPVGAAPIAPGPMVPPSSSSMYPM